MASGHLIVLTGPSSSGKTTIAADLLALDASLARLVTCTTRKPRPNEMNGADYHFLSREEFEASIKTGGFFEWANVYGDYYGSRKSDVEKMIQSGKSAVAVLDAQGATTVKQMMPQAVVIFVKVPIEELKKRLSQRAGFSKEELGKRIQELEREGNLSGGTDFVVENKDGHLSEAVIAVKEFLRSIH